MTFQNIEPPILKSDKLGRDVFSRSDRRRIIKKNPPPGLFLDDKSPTELSVHRLTPVPNQAPPANRSDLASDAEISKISVRLAKARKPPRNFYGWAELSAEDAGRDGRIVRATPKAKNRWHADIVLPAEARQEIRIRKKHARSLAYKAEWRPHSQDRRE